METIYGRLFRYKSRLDREPLEDFLSEALTDLFNRMPRLEMLQFLDAAIQTSGDPFSSSLQGKDLRWKTQQPIPGGIIDIALFAGGKPALVIENKTWSGFQDHSTAELEANQITTYCRWLASEASSKETCAVLLVTGTSSSPPGFHGEGAYAVHTRRQITWAAVGRWLKAKASLPEYTGATWRDLALDLVEFLKEKKLSSEVFVASDVSAAHLVLPSMDRWAGSFQTIWNASELIWRDFLNARLSSLTFNTEAGMLWQWKYGKPDLTPAKSWVSFGLRFPDQSNWYSGMSLPGQPHFLFVIGSDQGKLSSPKVLPSEWAYNESDGQFVSARSIDTFQDSPDLKIERLQSWAQSAMRDSKTILSTSSLQ